MGEADDGVVIGNEPRRILGGGQNVWTRFCHAYSALACCVTPSPFILLTIWKARAWKHVACRVCISFRLPQR
jgi:hypothetical protein